MNRPYRHPSAPKAEPVPVPVLTDRVLVGAFAALVAARPLVAGDDPGRLRLTTSGGPVSFTLCLFLVLIGFAVWRLAFGRGRPAGWAVVPVLIGGVGGAAFASVWIPDRYARPALFVGWEWVGLAVAYYLARRLMAAPGDSRGLWNVLLASAVSVGGLALYQTAADQLGLPSADVVVPTETAPLAGDDEFYPELNGPIASPRQPRGTFDSPQTLFIFLMLVLPASLAMAKARDTSRWGRWAVAVPLVLIAAAAAALALNPLGEETSRWSPAFRLVAEHPIFGVGPGSYSRMAPDAPPLAAWFGLAATTGLVGLTLFAAAIAVAFREARPLPTDVWDPPAAGPRWEFYLGGVTGLLLGLFWAAGAMPAEAPPNEVFRLGATAILRAVLWFASFALLDTLRPSRAALGRAVLLGAGIVLVYGLVSDAPGRPTVLFPMFVLLALGANFRTAAVGALPDGTWTKPVRVVRVLAAAGLAIAFLVTAAVPAWSTVDAVRQARMASRHYPERHRAIDQARPGAERATALTRARGFLLQNIIGPLRDAAERDPGNAALWLELARWRRPLWEYQLEADAAGAARVGVATREAAERAAYLDPHNPAGPRNFFEALLLFRQRSKTRQPERLAALNKVIAQVAERRPADEVPLRYRLVQTLLDHGDPEEAKTELVRLLELNRADGHGHLTAEQKTEIIGRAVKVLKDLPPIVAEEWTGGK